MELDERKKKILTAVIKNYLDTGEPVGSRTISKYADFTLSPATIRNEMSDLEEMGYIYQPHTSAGRIPTDAGYRLYIDDMLRDKKEHEAAEKKKKGGAKKGGAKDSQNAQAAGKESGGSAAGAEPEGTLARLDHIEEVLQNMAKILARNTEYTTVVSMPDAGKNKLRFVQLTQLDSLKLLTTIVLEGNIVKNRLIPMKRMLNQEELLKLNILFNNTLNGLALSEINFEMAAEMAEQDEEQSELISDVINAIVAAIGAEDGFKIFTSGATNIFKYPELSSRENASELISTLEEKKLLGTLLTDEDESDTDDNTGIQVYIGEETAVSSMKDCAVVTAKYEFEDGVYGRVGVIGPKRMDYEKVMEALKDVTGRLDREYSDNGKERQEA